MEHLKKHERLEEELRELPFVLDNHTRYIIEILHKQNKFLNHLNEKIDNMALDQTKINASLAQLNADVATLIANQTTNPADQAILDNAAAQIDALDATVKAAITPPTGG